MASIVALLLANLLFIRTVILDHSAESCRTMDLYLSLSTTLSALPLLVFRNTMWNKVQSWQLSTTTAKQKGLTGRQLKRLNQGRGVIGLLMNAALGLFLLPTDESSRLRVLKEDTRLSITIALVVLASVYYQYQLIKEYSKVIFVVYGGSKLAFALAILAQGLLTQTFSIQSLVEDHSYVRQFLMTEVYMVTACVEFGFLWYYLYSRDLITKPMVQTLCKNYHPFTFFVWCIFLQTSAWWRPNRLPIIMLWLPLLYTLLGSLFFFKMIKALITQPLFYESASTELKNCDTDDRSRQRRRSSNSIFEVPDEQGKRRSSIFEAIDVGLLEADTSSDAGDSQNGSKED